MNRRRCLDASVLLVSGLVWILGALQPVSAESFLDFLKHDKEQRKDFTQGKVTNEPGQKTTGPATVKAPAAATNQAEWLIMVYGAGDNNLDPALMADVQEMEKVGSSDRVRVVALVDRAKDAEWSTCRRFLVLKPADNAGKHSWETGTATCEDIGEVNTGDPKTLKDFITWSEQRYPARRTMLVLWNHGGGWRDHINRAMQGADGKSAKAVSPTLARLSRGVAWDDSSNQDFLETREVRQVLESVPKLTILSADACLMAMIEVAYEWKDRAEFLVASEHTEPNNGWPYDTILQSLSTNAAMTSRDFATKIVQLYGASYQGQDGATTQSAIDLSKIAAVAEAWDDVSAKLIRFLQGGAQLPESYRRFFGGVTFQGNPFLDFDTMAEVIAQEPAFGTDLQSAAQKTRQALAAAVVANYSAPPAGRGLSIYAGYTDEMPDYNAQIIRFARDTKWDEALVKLVAAYQQPQAARAKPPQRSADWLILVYQAADNNLDPYAIKDVEEMEKVGSSDRVKIVVLQDRGESGEWSTTRRFLVRKPADQGGKHSWDTSLETCKDLGELNTGDPATLKAFCEWGLREYPASNTMLVLWNHGGGWRSVMSRAVTRFQRGPGTPPGPAIAALSRGICWDDSSNGDFLESREVRQALEGLPKFSVIGADACLMGMLEVAYEWKDHASFFVASEEIEPGDGWPYETILAKLNAASPALPPKDLATSIVSLYGASYGNEKVTMSAVSMADVPALAQAVDKLADELMKSCLGSQARAGGAKFALSRGRIPGYPVGNPEFLDLDSLLEEFEKNPPCDGQVVPLTQAARAALSKAVVANFSHADLGGRGLSIYPGGGQNDADYRADIILFAKDTRWDDLLRAIAAAGGGTSASKSGAARQPEHWAVLIGVGDYKDPRVPDLQYSINDIEQLKEALIKNSGYKADHVIVLTDKDATTERVRSTLGTELPRKAAKEDMVLVYFSGHGAAEPSVTSDTVDGTEKYMMLSDSKVDDLYGTALPMSELARIFGRIQSDKVLFVLDSCYSGAAGARGVMRGGMRAIGLNDDYLTRLTGSQGTVVITASRANEVSMESPRLKHGVFTYYLLDVFSGKADTNGDGITTLSEAFQYLSSTVAAESKTLGASQNPVMKGEFTGEFPVAWSGAQK